MYGWELCSVCAIVLVMTHTHSTQTTQRHTYTCSEKSVKWEKTEEKEEVKNKRIDLKEPAILHTFTFTFTLTKPTYMMLHDLVVNEKFR